MNRRFLRLLPLFVAALWLPFQAIAATAMPFCRHGEAHRMVALADDAAMEHCAMHGQQQPAPDHGKTCDDCGFCHLAAAGMMPTPERCAAVIPAARDYRAEAPLAPASAIPEHAATSQTLGLTATAARYRGDNGRPRPRQVIVSGDSS